RRRAQGRPVDRTPDPRLPRAAQGSPHHRGARSAARRRRARWSGLMSVLVVGVSHRTASVDVLEQVTLDASGVDKLITAVAGSENVTEATVLSTCNRLEIYAEVERFHGTVEELSRLVCGVPAGEAVDPSLLGNLYVHYG